jgi:hypothetical protein
LLVFLLWQLTYNISQMDSVVSEEIDFGGLLGVVFGFLGPQEPGSPT